MDTTKNLQAAKIIAGELAKIPANAIMDYGTLGHSQGLTKREGEARSMAQYFVTKMYRVNFGGMPQYYTDEQKAALQADSEISAEALKIAGK